MDGPSSQSRNRDHLLRSWLQNVQLICKMLALKLDYKRNEGYRSVLPQWEGMFRHNAEGYHFPFCIDTSRFWSYKLTVVGRIFYYLLLKKMQIKHSLWPQCLSKYIAEEQRNWASKNIKERPWSAHKRFNKPSQAHSLQLKGLRHSFVFFCLVSFPKP